LLTLGLIILMFALFVSAGCDLSGDKQAKEDYIAKANAITDRQVAMDTKLSDMIGGSSNAQISKQAASDAKAYDEMVAELTALNTPEQFTQGNDMLISSFKKFSTALNSFSEAYKGGDTMNDAMKEKLLNAVKVYDAAVAEAHQAADMINAAKNS
jgi:hypothetical protein